MANRSQPDGGRYTRPRRGFRVKSHYRERLNRRGLSPRDVRMMSLDALRRQQGYVSRSSDGFDSKGSANKGVRRAYAGVQMPRGMREVASNLSSENWKENQEVE